MPNPYGRQLRATVVKSALFFGHGELLVHIICQHRKRVVRRRGISLYFLSMCFHRSDIPVRGILPHHPQGFELTKGAGILGINLEKTIRMLELEDYDLVMVRDVLLIASIFIKYISVLCTYNNNRSITNISTTKDTNSDQLRQN